MTYSIVQYTAMPTGGIAPMPRQASSDDQLVDLWQHGRSPHTQRVYAADAEGIRAYVGPLATATLGLVQGPSSRARTLAATKSLLSFGQRVGYLPMNVGAAVKLLR